MNLVIFFIMGNKGEFLLGPVGKKFKATNATVPLVIILLKRSK